MGRIVAGLLAALLWVAGTVHDAAAQGQPQYPLTRIAFGSCADEELPQPNWGAVLAYRPDLFLFTGTMSMET
jgi:alkaline phosphatase D